MTRLVPEGGTFRVTWVDAVRRGLKASASPSRQNSRHLRRDMQAESDAAVIDKREEAPKVWNGQQTLPRGLYTKRPGSQRSPRL